MEKSIAELKNQIYFSRTKEYFEEVEKSFYNENYRSAIVMLYSIVIADLLFKLEELRDYYNDSTAKKILEDINRIRESNPKSSEWENKLIEKIKKETNIIESYVLINIEHLKEVRNFSAHPALNQNNELIRPSREKTLGLIYEMLYGIFIRPPLFIKKITDNLLEDISSKKIDFLDDNEKFNLYVKKKYFERIPQNMIINIFRDFWKITFKLDSDVCNENRMINLQLLIIIMNEHKLKILEDMQRENEKYNNINESENIIMYLIEFIFYFPEVFDYLKQENQISLEVSIKKNSAYKTIAYYISRNMKEHINGLNGQNLENKHTRELIEKKIKEEGLENILIDKYIEIFGESRCYDSADLYFDNLIKPYLTKMQSPQIEKLLEKIDNNNQIYNRGKAEFDNNQIIEKSVIDWNKINLEKYKNFRYSNDILFAKQLPF